MDVLSIKRFVSSKSFLTLHINRFLSTFTKYLAVITLILRGGRGEYSYNLFPWESSSCKKQLNTTHTRCQKHRKRHQKIATNSWRVFTFYIGQVMFMPRSVFPFLGSTIKPLATETSEDIFDAYLI